jgi:hypothetical protein
MSAGKPINDNPTLGMYMSNSVEEDRYNGLTVTPAGCVKNANEA